MAHSSLVPAPHLRTPSCLRPPCPFHADRGCTKVTQPPPFPRPSHLPTPFAQAASRPTGVATPFASPHSSRPSFPPPPFSRKRGRKGASVHPLPVVRGHLPARFLATALETTPPRSPRPPACLAVCAHAGAQERQCATPPPFRSRTIPSPRVPPLPSSRVAPPPPPGLRAAPTRRPSARAAGAQHGQCATLPSTRVAPPPTPGLCAPPTLHPFACTAGAQHGQCDTLLLSVCGQSPPPGLRPPPPPGFPPRLARTPISPLRACWRRRGDSAPPPLSGRRGLPPFLSRAVPSARPPVCAHARGAGGTARPPSRPRQSPPLGLRHPRPPVLRAPPRPASAPSPFARACRGMVRPRPAPPPSPLVPAPPCRKLT